MSNEKNSKNNNYKNRNTKKTGRSSNRGRTSCDTSKATDSSFPTLKGQNNPAWYATDPALLAASANLSYAWPVGAPMDIAVWRDFTQYVDSVPGIMGIGIQPGIGASTNGSSAVNVAARAIYSYVRHANSGHSNYNSPDLMMYLLAMDSVYTMLANGVRAYGVARVYSQTNRYYPKELVQWMGFDIDDITTNLPNLRFGLLSAINKVASLAVPRGIPLFERHMELMSYLYTDTNDLTKCQTYVFAPTGYYRFMFDKYSEGGCLEYRPFGVAGVNDGGVLEGRFSSVDSYITILNDMIEVLLQDEDMNIMSGDILKAFGADKIFHIPTFTEDYMVAPTFNPEMMTQINNAVVLGFPQENEYAGFDSRDIYQHSNYIFYMPFFKNEQATSGLAELAIRRNKLILNMPLTNPTPADNIVATRLAAIASSGTTDDALITYDHLGSEVVTICAAGYYTYSPDGERIMQYWVIPSYDVLWNYTPAYGVHRMDWILTKFANHPRVYRYLFTEPEGNNPPSARYVGDIGDIDNYVLLSHHDLAKQHSTAMLSLFNVPSMGMWTSR